MEARRKKQTGLAMKRLSGNDPRLKDAAMLSCSHEQQWRHGTSAKHLTCYVCLHEKARVCIYYESQLAG